MAEINKDYASSVPIAGMPIWSAYDKRFRAAILFALELYKKKLRYVARLILRKIVSNALHSCSGELAGNKFQRSFPDKLVIILRDANCCCSKNPMVNRIIWAKAQIGGRK